MGANKQPIVACHLDRFSKLPLPPGKKSAGALVRKNSISNLSDTCLVYRTKQCFLEQTWSPRARFSCQARLIVYDHHNFRVSRDGNARAALRKKELRLACWLNGVVSVWRVNYYPITSRDVFILNLSRERHVDRIPMCFPERVNCRKLDGSENSFPIGRSRIKRRGWIYMRRSIDPAWMSNEIGNVRALAEIGKAIGTGNPWTGHVASVPRP